MRRALLAGLLLLLLPHAARADLKLCNRTSYVLRAATATVRGGNVLAEGWLHIDPGDCAVAVKGTLDAPHYLVYAHSSLAHAGPPRAWGGNVNVCVEEGNRFRLQQPPGGLCRAPGSFALPFAPVVPKDRRDWTMNFDNQPPLPSLTAAQLAGVKRLLTDNGYHVGAIDATPGKQTEAALNGFRRRMHFKPDADNAALFAALEDRAMKVSAPEGYAVCNDTAAPFLAAIARAQPGKPQSHGWWRIAPKGCARLVNASLDGAPVFLLVQTLSGTTLVGGREIFCTAAAAFAVEGRANCAARGLAGSGFAATAGHGAAGAVIHVGQQGIAQASIAK